MLLWLSWVYIGYSMRKLLLYCCTLLLTQCSKCKENDPNPEEQLPPATQTGANTFGCLVNGQTWTPQGNNGTANLRVTYDPGYAGGSLSIRAYRFIGDTDKQQSFILGGAPISQVGTYSCSMPVQYTAYFFDETKSRPCDSYYGTADLTCKGQLTITRLDLQAGIISGTFNFTLYKPGCDSVRVTNGRFDKKL